MIFGKNIKVCLATQPCDMRKSFDTLSHLVSEQLKEDPLSSKLFVFINKKANRIKILYADRSGLWILMKRLEQGCFARPSQTDRRNPKIYLKFEALEMLLAGIDLKNGMERAWYEYPQE